MKKILILLGIIKPFTHKPEDFRIKAERWWASPNERFIIKYSCNGGRSWKTIKESSEPLFDVTISIGYNWTYKDKVFDLRKTTPKEEIKKFPNYQSILDWENKQIDLYNKGFEEHKQKIRKYVEMINKSFKQ